jgi:hypothetical protein
MWAQSSLRAAAKVHMPRTSQLRCNAHNGLHALHGCCWPLLWCSKLQANSPFSFVLAPSHRVRPGAPTPPAHNAATMRQSMLCATQAWLRP